MRRPPARRRALAFAAATLAAALPLAGCETITEDEARCAEAVARLDDCCPGGVVRGAICDGNFSLTAGEAGCIEALSCEALRSGRDNTVCVEAGSRFGTGTPTDGGLCP